MFVVIAWVLDLCLLVMCIYLKDCCLGLLFAVLHSWFVYLCLVELCVCVDYLMLCCFSDEFGALVELFVLIVFYECGFEDYYYYGYGGVYVGFDLLFVGFASLFCLLEFGVRCFWVLMCEFGFVWF